MDTTTNTNDSIYPMTLHSSLIMRNPGGFAYTLCPVSTFVTSTHSYCNSLFSRARYRSSSVARCFVANNFPQTGALHPPILPIFAHIHTVFLAHCNRLHFSLPHCYPASVTIYSYHICCLIALMPMYIHFSLRGRPKRHKRNICYIIEPDGIPSICRRLGRQTMLLEKRPRDNSWLSGFVDVPSHVP